MGKALVLILEHSFIRRHRDHIGSPYDNGYTVKLGISTPDFFSANGMMLAVERLRKFKNRI